MPPHPGILCAKELLLTDLRTDHARTRLTPLEGAGPVVAAEFAALEGQAAAWFAAEGVPEGARSMRRTIDMRHAGQTDELPVPLPDGGDLAALRAAFEAEPRRMYGHIAEAEPVRMVTVRLEATGLVPKSRIAEHPRADHDLDEARTGTRSLWLPEAGGRADVPLCARAALGPGHRPTGPGIVEQMDSTTLVLPAQTVRVHPWPNIIVKDA